MMDSDANILHGILGLMLFLIPALVARVRKHSNVNAIFLVTVIAGGVAIASPIAGGCLWLFALVWAFMVTPAKQ